MPPSSEKKNPDGIKRRVVSTASHSRMARSEEKKSLVRQKRSLRNEREDKPTGDRQFFDALRSAAHEAREESRERFGGEALGEDAAVPTQNKVPHKERASPLRRNETVSSPPSLAEASIRARLYFVGSRLSRPLWAGIASVAVFGLLMLLLSTVFARVTVALKPRIENLTADNVAITFDITARTVGMDMRIVPAELLEYTKTFSKEFQAKIPYLEIELRFEDEGLIKSELKKIL